MVQGWRYVGSSWSRWSHACSRHKLLSLICLNHQHKLSSYFYCTLPIHVALVIFGTLSANSLLSTPNFKVYNLFWYFALAYLHFLDNFWLKSTHILKQNCTPSLFVVSNFTVLWQIESTANYECHLYFSF